MNVKIPTDLVAVGHITGAYGLQGWVRVHPYSAHAEAMLYAKGWWLGKSDVNYASSSNEQATLPPALLNDVERLEAKHHGEDVVAKLMGIVGRDAAQALKGSVVYISRSHFPVLSDGEYYWLDLIGLDVSNLQGESLGKVANLIDNGAHPILRVLLQTELDNSEVKPREYLIPFVEHFVPTVDLPNKKIVVDWGLDY